MECYLANESLSPTAYGLLNGNPSKTLIDETVSIAPPNTERDKWHMHGHIKSHHTIPQHAVSAWRGINETPEKLEAVKRINNAGKKYGISVLAASLRWLAYHSRLQSSDSIIIGADTWQEFEERVVEISRGPLPNEVVFLIDDVSRSSR